jgi:hypothetical protein
MALNCLVFVYRSVLWCNGLRFSPQLKIGRDRRARRALAWFDASEVVKVARAQTVWSATAVAAISTSAARGWQAGRCRHSTRPHDRTAAGVVAR